MARVVVATAFGGPEVLSIVDEDAGTPGEGEVRIAVRAAGVNPVDWKRYSGAMSTGAALPMRLGFEAAGVVAEAGAGAEGPAGGIADRKSTRLNSSHGYISYAVFCLKKKNKKKIYNRHIIKKKVNNS